MLSGQLYDLASDPELVKLRQTARDMTGAYNSTRAIVNATCAARCLIAFWGRWGRASKSSRLFAVTTERTSFSVTTSTPTFGCVLLDVAEIRIGANVLLGAERANLHRAPPARRCESRTAMLELGTPISHRR